MPKPNKPRTPAMNRPPTPKHHPNPCLDRHSRSPKPGTAWHVGLRHNRLAGFVGCGEQAVFAVCVEREICRSAVSPLPDRTSETTKSARGARRSVLELWRTSVRRGNRRAGQPADGLPPRAEHRARRAGAACPNEKSLKARVPSASPPPAPGPCPYRASGSGRIWKCTILLFVPLPPSVCQT